MGKKHFQKRGGDSNWMHQRHQDKKTRGYDNTALLIAQRSELWRSSHPQTASAPKVNSEIDALNLNSAALDPRLVASVAIAKSFPAGLPMGLSISCRVLEATFNTISHFPLAKAATNIATQLYHRC